MLQPPKAASAPPWPTTSLPSLKLIDSLSAASVSLSLSILKELYQPHHNLRPLVGDAVVDSGYASDEEYSPDDKADMDEAWDIVRADQIERSFAMRWMTGLIARSADWISASVSGQESEDREAVIDAVSTLLGSCVQVSEDGDIDREFVFPCTIRGEPHHVRVELQDRRLSTTDHTSVGLQTWGSSVIMIDKMCRDPAFYGLIIPSAGEDLFSDLRELRILELGAGTGLLSLVLGNMLSRAGVHSHIVSTDFHSAVLDNLRGNIADNPSSISPLVKISVEYLDWQAIYDYPDAPLDKPFNEPFDIIFAADVVYRPAHAEWIASTVRRLLRQPSNPPEETTAAVLSNNTQTFVCRPSFHLIAPIRPTHEHTCSSIETAFPPASSPASSSNTYGSYAPRIVHVEDSARTKGVGRADESSYREYKVEWS